MAESAMAQLECAKSRLKRLMLANLAGIVLFGKDTLATGNARREVTTTFAAACLILSNEGLAA